MVSDIICGIQNNKEDLRKVAYLSREDHWNVAGSATNLILAWCGIRLQFTKCTVWLRKWRFTLQFAYSFYNLRIPLTVFGIHIQLRVPEQLNFIIHMAYYLLVDFTNCSWFRKHGCKLRNIDHFWKIFEQPTVFGFCLWNLKH